STITILGGRRFDMPGQRYPDPGTSLLNRISRAVNYYLTVMLFDDRIDQRKAPPRPLAEVLGGKERLEQSVDHGLWNAAALIFRDQVQGVFGGFATDPDLAVFRRGVAGVGKQVDQYLAEPLRVSGDLVLRI